MDITPEEVAKISSTLSAITQIVRDIAIDQDASKATLASGAIIMSMEIETMLAQIVYRATPKSST